MWWMESTTSEINPFSNWEKSEGKKFEMRIAEWRAIKKFVLWIHSALRLEDNGFLDGLDDLFWIVDQLKDVQVSR